MPTYRRLTLCLLLGTTALTTGCATQPGAPVADGYSKPTYVRSARTQTVPAAQGAVAENTTYLNTRGIESAEPVQAEALPATLQPKSRRVGVAAKPVAVSPVAKAAAPAAAPQVEMVAYTIKPGDSLFKIASAHQTTVPEIMKMNGLASVSDVQPGTTLQVPANSRPVESAWSAVKGMLANRPAPVQAAPVQTAAVRKSADMATIEPAAGPTAVEGRQLASLKPAVALQPQPVAVSQPTSGYVEHTVAQKETIFRISQQYGVSVLDIMAANNFETPQDLKWGTKVRIPVKDAQPQSTVKVAPAKPVAATKPTLLAPSEAQVAARLEAAEAKVTEAKPADPAPVKPARVAVAVPGEDAAPQSAPVFEKTAPKKAEAMKAEMKRGQVDEEAAQTPGLAWPVKGKIVQRFGDAANGVSYTGINIAVPAGTPVVASEEGTVLYADDGLKTYGKMVLIRHKTGMVSAYAHNSFLLVRKGERVKKGQVIATSGATGNVDSPQLHFELRQHASAVDPLRVLPKL